MNTKTEISKARLLLKAIGVWAVCVCASVLATWGVSEVFHFRFNPSTVVVFSSVLLAIAYARNSRKKA
jgi:hypothetical protein